MYFALIGLLLSAQAPEVPKVGERVVVELRNGYRVEGILLEKDRRSALLSLHDGEVRFELNRVRRLYAPVTAKATPSEPQAPRTRSSVVVSSATGDQQHLVFSVPASWKKLDDETGRLVYASPQGEIRFQVERSADAKSLWRITSRIRRTYEEAHTGLEVKQERFGNRWQNVRTWEIDFEYREGEQRYRQRQLFLDFGATKQVFTFRTRAERFSSLVDRFESITANLTLTKTTSDAPAKKPPADKQDELLDAWRELPDG